jgi:hypothetical protein
MHMRPKEERRGEPLLAKFPDLVLSMLVDIAL